MDFKHWLEAVMQAPRLGIGGGDIDVPNDDDGDDDDDFDNGPWGWNVLQKQYNLALHEWAKTSKYVVQIKNILGRKLFEKPYKEENRVFWHCVQVEVEWLIEIDTWNELDDQIEAILKRSDLYKPLNIKQEELWSVVDKGAVYDFVYSVILLYLTGRNLSGGRSPMDDMASFAMYNWLREDWSTLEKSLKWDIAARYWPHEKNLDIELRTDTRSFSKPVGVSQATNYAQRLWAKGITQVPYQIKNLGDAKFVDEEESE